MRSSADALTTPQAMEPQMSANQYDASALRTELYADFEALRLKLREFSSRASSLNPHFAESAFDTQASECLDALREDLERVIEDADDHLQDAEAADGLEPGEFRSTPDFHPTFWR